MSEGEGEGGRARDQRVRRVGGSVLAEVPFLYVNNYCMPYFCQKIYKMIGKFREEWLKQNYWFGWRQGTLFAALP